LVFQYFAIIPLIVGIMLIQKALNGTRYPFVFVIASLILVTNFSELLFNSVFICEEPGGPKYKATDKTIYPNWNIWYIIVFYLTTLGNYVFFVCLYKWWATYRNQKVNSEVESLCNELLA